ncbi:MAG TPA: GNAT family N-acetyltransferase [Acidimicrobiales bacterium]|nr:GNAT family N-acetyltransferase [Acidimicrobiales bacterium]
MVHGPTIETERLRLRRWRESDLQPFAAINADPAVMEFFPYPLDRERSDALAAAADGAFDRDGYGLFAVEVRGGDGFIGFVGLSFVGGDLPCQGSVEIGWRLARHVWGRGYATEAAQACLPFAFEECGRSELVSFTSVLNERSQQVMRKIGMHRDPGGDFEHPSIEPGHRLRPHVLYRLTAEEWRRSARDAGGAG